MNALQEFLDTFYFQNGPCCAGCDWWHAHNSHIGECTKSKPMPGKDRIAMLGIYNCSAPLGTGHALTTKGHHCGDFKDDFDWETVPLTYLKRIGARS